MEINITGGGNGDYRPLADAQAGKYFDDVDVPRMAEWQRYRYKLTKSRYQYRA